MRPSSGFRITQDTLKGVLAIYASAWASEAVRYRELQTHAQDIERAFAFGMSNGFEDSADQLIKLLDEPTLSTMFNLLQKLEDCRAQADHYYDGLENDPSLSAYTSGIAEAYKTCGEYLTDVLIEMMIAAPLRTDYLS